MSEKLELLSLLAFVGTNSLSPGYRIPGHERTLSSKSELPARLNAGKILNKEWESLFFYYLGPSAGTQIGYLNSMTGGNCCSNQGCSR